MTRMRACVVRLAVLALLVAAPALLDNYRTFLLTEILIFGLFAASLDLLIGYSGLPSLGHAGYYGVGAYAAGLLALHATTNAFAQIAVATGAAAVVGARHRRLRRPLPRRLLPDADARVRAAALGARAQLDVADGRLERDLRDRRRRRSRAARRCSRDTTTSTGTRSASSSSATRCSGSSCARRSAARSRRSARTRRAMRSLGYNVPLYKLAAFTIAGARRRLRGRARLPAAEVLLAGGDVVRGLGASRSSRSSSAASGRCIGAVLGAAFYYVLRDQLSNVLSSHWQLVLGVVFVLVVYLLPGGFVGGGRRLACGGARAMTAVLELDGVGRRYGELHAVDDVTLDGRGGLAARADRPERRRQVDALPPDLGHGQGLDAGRIRFAGSRRHAPRSAPAHAARHGPHLPALEPLRRADARARTSPSPSSGSSATPATRPARRAATTTSMRAPSELLALVGLAELGDGGHAGRSRTATAASSRSRSRSRPSRRCCCSTSRRRACPATRRARFLSS